MQVEYVVHLICRCLCHRDSRIQPIVSYQGVDIVRDVELTGGIETVTACDSCIDDHCPALLLTRLANDPQPERREKFEWIDPPPQPEIVPPTDYDDGN